jgi:hypothetical protein
MIKIDPAVKGYQGFLSVSERSVFSRCLRCSLSQEGSVSVMEP